MPLLSIVITNYNHGKYLPKAIDSLLDQKYQDYEILIIDDASTDNSLGVIDSYIAQYPFIRLIRHEKNRGVCFSLCEGVDEAKGVYLHTMGADDYRLPGFMDKTMKILVEHPEIGVACSDFGYVMGEKNDGPVLREQLIGSVQGPSVFQPSQIVSVFQTTHFWVPGHTAILKRELARKYGKYNSALKFYCDWFLLHQIALNHGAAYVPDTLSVWWIHTNSYSTNLLGDKKNKNSVYHSVLNILSKKENKKSRRLFMQSTLLAVVLKSLLKDLIWKPKYWPYFAYLAKKSIYWRVQALKKRIKWRLYYL